MEVNVGLEVAVDRRGRVSWEWGNWAVISAAEVKVSIVKVR